MTTQEELFKNVSIALMSDGYKSSHPLFTKPIDAMASYMEARIPGVDNIVFGAKYYIDNFINHILTKEDVDVGEKTFLELNGIYDRSSWDKIVSNGGHIPMRIRTIPEGTAIPSQCAYTTFLSTSKDAPLIPGWAETVSMRLWYGNAVATGAFQNRILMEKYVRETCDGTPAELRQIAKFMLHDFGARSVTCSEQAMIGGAAHLTSFEGSDNPEGVIFAQRVYGAKGKIASTIPASEHFAINSWGLSFEDELTAHEHAYNQFGRKDSPYASPLYSDVIDSNDMFRMFREKFCRDLFLREDRNAKIIVRLDSGNPVDVVNKILDIAEDEGIEYRVNSKGYKVFDQFGILSSDGCWIKEIQEILAMLKRRGYAASLIVFGVGGRALQSVTRDMYSVAIKGSCVLYNGEWHDIAKSPKTDPSKKSKRGRLDTVYRDNKIQTIVLKDDEIQAPDSILFTAYEDGVTHYKQKNEFNEIRARVDHAVDTYLALPADTLDKVIEGWINFHNAQRGIPRSAFVV